MSTLVNFERRGFLRRLVASASGCGVSGLTLSEPSPRVASSRQREKANVVAFVPAPGHVVPISGPGTDAPSTLSQVMYWTAAGPGSRDGNNYFANWCSGVYAPDDGPLGSMVFCNGGDADYWGNEVYRFALDSRTWSRVSERSTGLNGKTATPEDDPNFDATWGEHISPGGKPPPQPGVPHSYDQMEYLPPHLGGGPRGSFLFTTRTIVYRFRRFRHSHAFDLASLRWRRGSAQPGIIGIGQVDAPSWCLDTRRYCYWGMEGGASGIYITRVHRLVFDPNTGLATAHAISIPRFLTPWDCPVSRYWPRGDLMVVAGVSGDRKTFGLWACALSDNGKNGFIDLPLAGSSLPPPGAGYGFAYCGDLDCFFVRAAQGHRQKIWKILPPKSDLLVNVWQVEEIVMEGATVLPKDNGQGMWKRLMYAPSMKCLLWVDDTHGPVYAYRPAGT